MGNFFSIFSFSLPLLTVTKLISVVLAIKIFDVNYSCHIVWLKAVVNAQVLTSAHPLCLGEEESFADLTEQSC